MRLYPHVAVVAPGLSLSRRRALAAAARSIGVTTGVDERIRATEAELQTLAEPVPSRADARRRVAETAADLDAERERVATIRGRLQEADDGSLRDDYRSALGALSEAETEHAAATEALESARERARAARDDRDRRLRLQDRLENDRRAARAELVDAVGPAVRLALGALPSRTPASFEAADAVSAALALVRAGRVETPVTLACRRFEGRDAAERWLEAPVYRI